MADLFHWWGQDLVLTSSGDLALSDGLMKDNQRIFRRLCTNGGQSGAQVAEYMFHPNYGGSAPWYVGRTTDEATLEGVIRSQMYQETAVAHDPEPIITPHVSPDGTFDVKIQYTDAATGDAVPPLYLNVTE
jgi:hypothetical protein